MSFNLQRWRRPSLSCRTFLSV